VSDGVKRVTQFLSAVDISKQTVAVGAAGETTTTKQRHISAIITTMIT
jgi:hypothetical protein